MLSFLPSSSHRPPLFRWPVCRFFMMIGDVARVVRAPLFPCCPIPASAAVHEKAHEKRCLTHSTHALPQSTKSGSFSTHSRHQEPEPGFHRNQFFLEARGRCSRRAFFAFSSCCLFSDMQGCTLTACCCERERRFRIIIRSLFLMYFLSALQEARLFRTRQTCSWSWKLEFIIKKALLLLTWILTYSPASSKHQQDMSSRIS